MVKGMEFENWLSRMDEISQKYYGESNNVVKLFQKANDDIGWKGKAVFNLEGSGSSE